MRPKTAVLRFWNNYDARHASMADERAAPYPSSRRDTPRPERPGRRRELLRLHLARVVSSLAISAILFLALPLIGAIAAAGTARLASRLSPLLLLLLAVSWECSCCLQAAC